LTAINLLHNNVTNVKHFSFGSPRLYNPVAAMYVSKLLLSVRTTHYRDIVPHTPVVSLGYRHITTEWYENNRGVISECKGGESPFCADQWVFQENTADHMVYLGRNIRCVLNDTLSALDNLPTGTSAG
jgi:hypothetical protein